MKDLIGSLVCLTHLFSNNLNWDSWHDANRYLLPQPEHLQSCVSSRKNKFCFVHVGMQAKDFTPGFNASRLTLSAGMCLPKHCHEMEIGALVSGLCALPDCRVFVSPIMMETCGLLQKALCGPHRRHLFEHELALECAYRGSQFAPSIFVPNPLERFIIWSKDWRERLESLYHSWISSNDGDTYTMPVDVMDSILSCGVGSLRHVAGLVKSEHRLQGLGDFDGCEKDDDSGVGNGTHFCSIRYHALLGNGRCVPKVCTGRKLDTMLNWMCDVISQGRSCIDLLNIVPLDLCVQTSIFGCKSRHFKVIDDDDRFDMGLDSLRELRDVDNLNIAALSTIKQVLETIEISDRKLKGYNTIESLFGGYKTQEMLIKMGITYLPQAAKIALGNFNAELLAPQISNNSPTKHIDMPKLSFTTSKARERLHKHFDVLKDAHKSYCNYYVPNWTLGHILSLFLLAMVFVVLPILGVLSRPVCLRGSEARETTTPRVRNGSKSEKSLCNFFLKFDISTNFDLWKRSVLELSQGSLSHMCGMRTLSMFWIIVGHTLTSDIYGGLLANLPHAVHLLKDLPFQMIFGASFAVDSFFVYSGFLLAFLGSRSLEKSFMKHSKSHDSRDDFNGKSPNTMDAYQLPAVPPSSIIAPTTTERFANAQPYHLSSPDNLPQGHEKSCTFGAYMRVFFLAIIRRYIRLSSCYFLLLFLWIHGVPYLVTAAHWPFLQDVIKHGLYGGCRKHWLSNIFYVSNLYKWNDCFAWAWYLSNDFQFSVICTAVLLLRRASKKAGNISLGILSVVSLIACSANVVSKDISLVIKFDASESNGIPGQQLFYGRPWNRIQPYLVGFLAGLWLNSPSFSKSFGILTHGRRDPITNTIIPRGGRVFSLHLLSLIIMATLILSPFIANNSDKYYWPTWLDRTYLILSRPIWGICVAWFLVSLATVSGKNGVRTLERTTIITSKMLSQKIWAALSTVVFSAYLLHPALQQMFAAAQVPPRYVTQPRIWFLAIGWILISFLLAFPLVITTEIPASNISRIFT